EKGPGKVGGQGTRLRGAVVELDNLQVPVARTGRQVDVTDVLEQVAGAVVHAGEDALVVAEYQARLAGQGIDEREQLVRIGRTVECVVEAAPEHVRAAVIELGNVGEPQRGGVDKRVVWFAEEVQIPREWPGIDASRVDNSVGFARSGVDTVNGRDRRWTGGK